MSGDAIDVLRDNLGRLNKSVGWLRRSYDKCSGIGVKKDYSEGDFDAFENLVSRYARTIDMIVNKVFRGIDAAELEDSGTTIDVVNRAEKRGIVTSAADPRVYPRGIGAGRSHGAILPAVLLRLSGGRKPAQVRLHALG